jgi:hypothetical protein
MSTTIRLMVGLSLVVAVTGCGAFDKPYLDPKVAAQVTVTKNEPPPGCEWVGFVKGTTVIGELSEAHTDVLRNAVLRGGNYVAVDLVEKSMLGDIAGYTVRGRLFSCPSRPAPVAAAPIAAAPPAPPAPAAAAPAAPPADASVVKACEPDCAAGFACQLGVCVAALPAQAAAPTGR